MRLEPQPIKLRWQMHILFLFMLVAIFLQLMLVLEPNIFGYSTGMPNTGGGVQITEFIEIGKPVEWSKPIAQVEPQYAVAESAERTIDLPTYAQNIRVKDVVLDVIIDENLYTISSDLLKTQIAFSEEISEEKINDFEILYATPSPEVEEVEINSSAKQITVYSDISYKNVKTYTSIQNAKQEKIKLYWYINGFKTDVTEDFQVSLIYKDTDGDNLIDRLEWITPHLSNQTFEVTIEVLNVVTYLKDNELWRVEFNVSGTADLSIESPNATWTETLLDLNDTVDELDFRNILCGDTDMSSQLKLIDAEGTVILYSDLSVEDNFKPVKFLIENYTCSETSYFDNYVYIAGYAALTFTFGNETAWAYDPFPDCGSHTPFGCSSEPNGCTQQANCLWCDGDNICYNAVAVEPTCATVCTGSCLGPGECSASDSEPSAVYVQIYPVGPNDTSDLTLKGGCDDDNDATLSIYWTVWNSSTETMPDNEKLAYSGTTTVNDNQETTLQTIPYDATILGEVWRANVSCVDSLSQESAQSDTSSREILFGPIVYENRTLTQNYDNEVLTNLTINTSEVILDCANYYIDSDDEYVLNASHVENITIKNCLIAANGTSTSYGLYLNNVSNSTISDINSSVTGEFALYLDGDNNDIINSNFSAITNAVKIAIFSSDNRLINNTLNATNSLIIDESEPTDFNQLIYNNTNAQVNWNLSDLDIAVGGILDLGADINLTSNLIEVNSVAFPSFLTTIANLTFYGLSINEPYPYKDGALCDAGICSDVENSGSTYQFDVTGFSNYSVGEGSGLPICTNTTDDDVDPVAGVDWFINDTTRCENGSIILTLSNLTIINNATLYITNATVIVNGMGGPGQTFENIAYGDVVIENGTIELSNSSFSANRILIGKNVTYTDIWIDSSSRFFARNSSISVIDIFNNNTFSLNDLTNLTFSIFDVTDSNIWSGAGNPYTLGFTNDSEGLNLINTDNVLDFYGLSFTARDYIYSASSTGILPELSFTAWVKPGSLSGNKTIIAEGDMYDDYGFWFGFEEGVLTLRVADGYSGFDEYIASTDGAYTLNDWQHVGFTHGLFGSLRTTGLYRNGTTVSYTYDSSSGNSMNPDAGLIYIGTSEDYWEGLQYNYSGVIRDARFYDDYISLGRANADMNDRGIGEDMIYWWRMNDGTGTAVTDKIDSKDLSFAGGLSAPAWFGSAIHKRIVYTDMTTTTPDQVYWSSNNSINWLTENVNFTRAKYLGMVGSDSSFSYSNFNEFETGDSFYVDDAILSTFASNHSIADEELFGDSAIIAHRHNDSEVDKIIATKAEINEPAFQFLEILGGEISFRDLDCISLSVSEEAYVNFSEGSAVFAAHGNATINGTLNFTDLLVPPNLDIIFRNFNASVGHFESENGMIILRTTGENDFGRFNTTIPASGIWTAMEGNILFSNLTTYGIFDCSEANCTFGSLKIGDSGTYIASRYFTTISDTPHDALLIEGIYTGTNGTLEINNLLDGYTYVKAQSNGRYEYNTETVVLKDGVGGNEVCGVDSTDVLSFYNLNISEGTSCGLLDGSINVTNNLFVETGSKLNTYYESCDNINDYNNITVKNITYLNGTLDANCSYVNDPTIEFNITIIDSGGNYSATNGTTLITHDDTMLCWNNTDGVFEDNLGTVNFTGDCQILAGGRDNESQNFFNLELAQAGKDNFIVDTALQVWGNTTLELDGALRLDGGTLTVVSPGNLYLKRDYSDGYMLTSDSTGTINGTGFVDMDGSQDSLDVYLPSGIIYNTTFVLRSSHNSAIYRITADIIFTVLNITTQEITETVKFDASGYDVTMNRLHLYLLNMGTAEYIAGTGDLNVTAVLNLSDDSGGTTTFTGGSGTHTINKLEIGANTAYTATSGLTNLTGTSTALKIDGTFSHNDGQFDVSGSGATKNLYAKNAKFYDLNVYDGSLTVFQEDITVENILDIDELTEISGGNEITLGTSSASATAELSSLYSDSSSNQSTLKSASISYPAKITAGPQWYQAGAENNWNISGLDFATNHIVISTEGLADSTEIFIDDNCWFYDVNVSEADRFEIYDNAFINFNGTTNLTETSNITFIDGQAKGLNVNDTNMTFINGTNFAVNMLTQFVPDADGFSNVGAYVNVTNIAETASMYLNISYDEAIIIAEGMTESTLRMSKHDGSNWNPIEESGVDETENVVYSEDVTSFSIFAPGPMDDQAPQWDTAQKNATNVYIGNLVELNVTWNESEVFDRGLDGYMFSTNDSGAWVNHTYIPFAGVQNESNYTISVQGAGGDITGWQFYANDTVHNTNESDVFEFTITPKSVAINLAGFFDSRLNWSTMIPDASDSPADGNNGAGVTEYYIDVAEAIGMTVDVYLNASGHLESQSGVEIIDLVNEKISNSTVDNTVPVSEKYSLTTQPTDNRIGELLGTNDKVYLKFFISVPVNQAAGEYNNSLWFVANETENAL